MIVGSARDWTVLQVTSNFWVIGDPNARFCPPVLMTQRAPGVTFDTNACCNAGAASNDCTQDTALKGFGL